MVLCQFQLAFLKETPIIYIIMTPVDAETKKRSLPKKGIVVLAVGLLLLGWLLNTPEGLLGKADAVGYAVCHRIEARSFHLGERPIPLSSVAAIELAEGPSEVRRVEGSRVALVTAKKLWTPGKGKTPEATLYAAILREIGAKGGQARFKKVDRGLFEHAG